MGETLPIDFIHQVMCHDKVTWQLPCISFHNVGEHVLRTLLHFESNAPISVVLPSDIAY
jgi:hypothetical protein